jgi:hypothetical protein
MWPFRAAGFLRAGLRIEEEATIRPDRGSTTPDEFLFALERRFNWEDGEVPVYVADSHANGALVARDHPLNRIVNFDAHHDLGYSSDERIAQDVRAGMVDAGNWAVWALDSGMATGYKVVYPDWAGTREFGASKALHRRATIGVWSDWLTSEPDDEEVEAILLVRSSSWTPPWLDNDFDHFAQALQDKFGSGLVWMDREHEPKISPWYPDEPREWDPAEAEELRASLDESLAALEAQK